MTFLLLTWLALFGVLILLLVKDGHRSGALTLSYFLALALIHVPGALTFAASTFGHEETQLGLQVTVIGVAFFVLGVAAAQHLNNQGETQRIEDAPLDADWLNAIGRKFFVIGVFVFFIVIPIAAEIPSVTAVLSGFVGLLVIGIWLWLCAAIIKRDRRRVVLVLGLLPLLPFATLTAIGFVSFATQWILTVLSFLFVMARRKVFLIMLMPFLAYFSLSMFIAYIGERNAIRDVVWYEEADVRTRLDRISDIFTNFEFMDLSDNRHAAAIESRLNQNSLVGAAVANLDEGSVDFAYGATVPWWSFIPRAIWPDKPEVGGGRNVVSDFTGFYFPEGTSVGAGQVLEFYVNFGMVGLIVGFFIWGYLLMTMDRRISRAMVEADMPTLLRSSMVGLTLVNPGGNLLEIVIAAVGAYLATPAILYLDRKLRALPMAVFQSRMKAARPQRP